MKNFFRFLVSQLSFFYKNKKINKKYETKVIEEITKFYQKKISNNNKLKTHVMFNNYIKKLIIEKKFSNFLRENIIQKIFFVHNRIYILFMLFKIIFNKNKLYKKLLLEDNIGNPIRYFLYPKSSGNRIREVFHLLNFQNFSKISLNRIKIIFEFGGGYGNMARLFYKINKNINYKIFDTFHVNLLQYYYLRMLKIPSTFNELKNKNISLNYNISKYNSFSKTDKKLFIANWSLSESPLKLRKIIFNKIINFDYILISYQEKFESINNHLYFSDIAKSFNHKKFIVKLFKIPFMNFLRLSNNNYYLFVKKIRLS
jgi:hypothetical protein